MAREIYIRGNNLIIDGKEVVGYSFEGFPEEEIKAFIIDIEKALKGEANGTS